MNKEELLQRIARYLMLHASFYDNIGLLNGKTGIAIFFYHYAKHSGKSFYADFARELIAEIYKEIQVNTPLNFADGLCGIAWGLGYLIKNGFVKANPDEVLEDLDKRIMEWDVRRISDISLETGLQGIACYATSRMENREKEHTIIRTDYISDLIEALKRKEETINPELLKAINQLVQSYNPVFEIVDRIKYNQKMNFNTNQALGIAKSGYTGIGLKLIEINKQ